MSSLEFVFADGLQTQSILNLFEAHWNYLMVETQTILNSTEIDQIKQLTTQLESALNLSRGKISYAELAAKLGLIENELDELKTSLAAKKSQLGGVDEEAVSSLAGALEKTQKDKRKIDQEIGSIEKTISDNLAKKRKLEAKISGISGQVHGLDL